MTVQKGEIYVLLGRNGAGKSTLFKILTGLSKASNGSITILNEDKDLEKVKSKIGSNINEPVFYEHLSAVENLEIHCDYMESSKKRIPEWLKVVGLAVDNDRPVKEYSLGMRQRLVLARSLVHDPELIIIDEPLNGLVATHQDGLEDFLISKMEGEY